MQYFNIQVASQLSGVATATIRAWEKRYQAVVPDRSDNKHRLYSELDIEKLSILFKLTEQGQSIGKIAHLDLEELKKIYSLLFKKTYESGTQIYTEDSQENFDRILNGLLLALKAYKIEIISHELEKAANELSPRSFSLNIILPLVRKIGQEVYAGNLGIGQEHTLSALISFYAGQIIGQHYKKKTVSQDLILITTPEGELHSLGILMSAILCVHYGKRFLYLGPNLPASSLSEVCNSLKAKWVLIGTTYRVSREDDEKLITYLNDINRQTNNNPKILLGGSISTNSRPVLNSLNVTIFDDLLSLDNFLKN